MGGVGRRAPRSTAPDRPRERCRRRLGCAVAGLDPPCYRGVVENSVYVGWPARGRGVGRALLSELVRRADDEGVWTIQAGIMDGNDASVALHIACGFRIVGTRERLAQKHGVWRDVLVLERRSPTALTPVSDTGHVRPGAETFRPARGTAVHSCNGLQPGVGTSGPGEARVTLL